MAFAKVFQCVRAAAVHTMAPLLMPRTVSQEIRAPFIKTRAKPKNRHLEGCPQKRGVCLRVYTTSPRKPNSAVRKVTRVRLSTGREVIAYIPGEGHTLQEHSIVLVCGGGPPDLPGVNYRVVRGARDCDGVKGRRTSRSKYGTPRPDDD